MTPETVFTNDYYTVVTGMMFGVKGVKIYKVINLQYDLVEVETTILVRAISLARDYADFLGRLEADANDEENPPVDDEDILEFEVPPEDMNVVIESVGFEADFDPSEPPDATA